VLVASYNAQQCTPIHAWYARQQKGGRLHAVRRERVQNGKLLAAAHKALRGAAVRRCRSSGNECWGPARGQGRADKGGNGGRYCRLQCMCQRLRMVCRGVLVRRRYSEMQACWAVQRVVAAVHGAIIIVAQHHQFDGAAGSADQLHGLGVNQRRCNGHTHRQYKPRQDQAGQQ